MKLPEIFIPDKNLKERIRQLFEEPKDPTKEALIQEINSQLDLVPSQRDIQLQTMTDELLSKEGYTPLTSQSVIGQYWTKETDLEQIKVFFKKREVLYKMLRDTYGFALLNRKDIGKFCTSLKKYEKEQLESYNLDYNFTFGGTLIDTLMHIKTKEQMIKICSYYTEDEKEALRMI